MTQEGLKMSHLHLVPALPAKLLPPLPKCHCEMPAGRYWLKGEWHCIATDDVVRIGSYAGKGWHHYPGHRRDWQQPQSLKAAA